MHQPADLDRPSPARVYDALAGGTGWLAGDGDLAARMLGLYPGAADLVRANRMYLAFAVMQARNAGITQFLDLGCGLPSAGSVPDVALSHDPEARILCADHDEDVSAPLSFGALMLEDRAGKNAAMVCADVREPGKVLAAAEGLIDLAQPCCLVFGLVLHTMPPEEARAVIAGYADIVAAGSFVAATVVRGCGNPAFGRMRDEWEAGTGGQRQDFGHADVAGLFEGLAVQGEIGPVAGLRLAGPCEEPHVSGGIGVKH